MSLSRQPLSRWMPLGRGDASPWPTLDDDCRPSEPPEHVGLWLDRYLVERPAREEDDGDHPGRKTLQAVATHPWTWEHVRENYRPVFRRWRAMVEAPEAGVQRWVREVEAQSRLLLHPATGETVTEGSVLLHHTYGVPYLPGSGLKGLMRAEARRRPWLDEGALVDPELRDGSVPPAERGTGSFARSNAGLRDAERDGWRVKDLFGTLSETRGTLGTRSLVDCLDALWIPEAPSPGQERSPLAVDVVTPHHAEYYTGEGGVAPADSDSPVPVQRISVAPKARFLLVVEIPDFAGAEEVVQQLGEGLLLPALARGVGAWSASGYGRVAAVGGGRAASAQRKVVPEEWVIATVTLDPGPGRLTAKLPDGRKLLANGTDGNALRRELPEAEQQRFKKNREWRGEVRIAQEGSNWVILQLGRR